MKKVITLGVLAACAWLAMTAAGASTRALPPAGERLGSIEINTATVKLDAPLTQGGWDLYDGTPWPVELNHGPAHYRNTPMPWQPGTSAFAGHRTTFTHPFGRINLLRNGDRITLVTRRGTFVYRVYKMRIVKPTDLAILRAPRRGHRLLLTACHPPHRATFRIAVWARLINP